MSSKSRSKKETLFAYLKPCQPAPGIATGLATDDSFNWPRRLGKWRRRWLALAFSAAQALAVGGGLWMSHPTEVAPARGLPQVVAQDQLWTYLGSDAYAQDQLAGKLAAAEQERLLAQQLRINAEENAENLLATAAQRARNKTRSAVRQAEAITLDATFNGAEQVIYGEAGDEVTLKFAARIQCKEGSFGETAVATPPDWRIAPREVRNLKTCFVSAHTPAGKPVGEIGEWGVAFFKMRQ